MPYIPFFTNTHDTTPDFRRAWRRYGNQCSHSRLQAREEYYKAVANNQVMISMISDLTMSEHEMRYYGKVTEPSESRIREIYGSDLPDLRTKPTRKRKNLADHDLNSQIDDIRNARGKYAIKKRPNRELDQEARRRGIKSTTDRQTESGGGGIIGIAMAFVGIAIVLMIGMMIFGAVENSVDMNYGLNSTADSTGWGVQQKEYKDPLEMVLEPFYYLTD